jgi:Cdc6-like AAA superfamily ATPase
MKFYETHFEEYTTKTKTENLHPKLDKLFSKFPANLTNLKNLIFYGPSGVGKYSQMLHLIQKYSPTNLKYEKKISVTYNKQQFFFKISDIHYEVDMSLLGCNSKLLWHDIYQQIADSISAKPDKAGIIVCKNYHEIHSELLDNFYSYMQKNHSPTGTIDLKFILLTEELSFIPDPILNCCEIIHVPRPTRAAYTRCLNYKVPNNIRLENITNIKGLHLYNEDLMLQYKNICNKIIDRMIFIEDTQFLKFRDVLYDIFIYNLDITDCVWYIISTLVEKNKIDDADLSKILIKTYCFFQYYNNNYRPIYHLENYLFYLIKVIHAF